MSYVGTAVCIALGDRVYLESIAGLLLLVTVVLLVIVRVLLFR